jgi:fructuronate reductase
VIVHLGLGAFHRAHQAVYTEDAGGWEICGVTRRSRAVAGPYTVVSRGPDGDSAREISVIREALVAADKPDAVVQRIAAAELVTLTITEAGYERGGMLELLARGISKRSAPLTVISCDNVPRNGEVLRDLLGAPPGVSFPCTVVDRIVPAPEDPLTVIAEPFSWWVIEHFDGPRPDWNVQFVEHSRPYEQMKLRLLNGSHTALAALGIPKGHATVAEAISDPELHTFVRRLLDEELLPTVVAPGAGDYAETMLERFANPRIEHRLEQIATGAEHKVRQRLIPAADELRAAGREPELIDQVVRRALR